MKQTEIFYKRFEKNGEVYVKIIKIKNVAEIQNLPLEYRQGYPVYYLDDDYINHYRRNTVVCIKDVHGLSRFLIEGEVYSLFSFAGMVLTMRQAGERLHKIIKEMNEVKVARI